MIIELGRVTTETKQTAGPNQGDNLVMPPGKN
jgi:hypothetical protein